jgi:rhodanese-related sulfurtransferase
MLGSLKTAFLAFAALAAVGTATPAAAEDKAPMTIDGATTVNATKVIELFQGKQDLRIVDSRKPGDYKAGHIETAINLPNTETDGQSLADILPAKDTPALFYCNGITCGRAADAVRIAVDAGYTNVYYYAKGMAEWKDKGLPLVRQ